ncbi:MAG: DHHW family protein [Christensenellales bacterium]
MKKHIYKLNSSKALPILFLTIVFGFSILSFVIPDKAKSAEENRVLAQTPSLSYQTYFEGRFQTKLEQYFNDQFPFRNSLIKWKTASDLTLDIIESNGVIKSKDGYLIERIKNPSENNIRHDIKSLDNFKRSNPNCNFYFLLAPNAGNIMSEKLPRTVHMSNQNKYMTSFFNDLKKIGITPIDSRKTLEKNIDKQQLYYRTDHHWTTGAAYLAYKEAHKEMGLDSDIKYKKLSIHRNFRGTLASKSGFTNGRNDELQIYWPKKNQNYHDSIYNFVDVKKTTNTFYAFDNLKKKDAYTIFGGWNHPFYTISTPTQSTRKLLLVKDSYANCMIPFLTQDFRKIVVVDPRYYFGDINKIMAEEGITDVLFLYNGLTFASDEAMNLMLDE